MHVTVTSVRFNNFCRGVFTILLQINSDGKCLNVFERRLFNRVHLLYCDLRMFNVDQMSFVYSAFMNSLGGRFVCVWLHMLCYILCRPTINTSPIIYKHNIVSICLEH